jgi:TolB-like protein/class 3 adenylate cyclase
MAEERVQRRLATILAADMVAYSRLMGEDEEATAEALKTSRKTIDGLIADHKGRVFHSAGDSVIAEFNSPVEALRCAVNIQKALLEANKGVPANRRMEFRIGVNIGDIMVEGDNMLGDGVNVAARLEALADAGGICISRNVFDQVHSKVKLGFKDIGPQKVKNIAEPVPAYTVLPDQADVGKVIPAKRKLAPTSQWAAGIAAVILVLVGAGAAWWQPWTPDVEPASVKSKTLALPAKPSIAVLPFDNLSGDPEQQFFSDGITEDIITDLSKVSGLFVIARNTSFQYRGKALDLVAVGRKLRVKYILEGSVRRSGDRVRINAQLIDVATGGHVWAERYTGPLGDVFSLQDKVAVKIITALKLKLTPSERKAVTSLGTNNPEAYDAYLRGLRFLASGKRIDVKNNLAAQAEFKKAIRIDPNYASAIAGLAWAKWLHIATINYYEPTDEMLSLAEKSRSIKDNALARRVLSRRYFALESEAVSTARKPHQAAAQLEAARKLEPNNPDVLADLARMLSFAGRPKEALDLIQKAMRLNPDHPDWYYGASGIALLLSGQPKRAVSHLRKWSKSNTSWWPPYIFLAAALAKSGDIASAKAAVASYGEFFGRGIRTTLYGVNHIYPMDDAQKKLFQSGLKLAGVK